MMVVPLLLVSLCSLSQGLQHRVGDSIWSIPPTGDFYANWSSSYTFHTGDTLRNFLNLTTLHFEFDSGLYNVLQVSRGEFDFCTGDQPYNAAMEGPATLPLPRKGVFYYICNVSNYCVLGQKVSIIVQQSPSPA